MNDLLMEQLYRSEEASRPPVKDTAAGALLRELAAAITTGDETARLEFHYALYRLNRRRFTVAGFDCPIQEQRINSICVWLEEQWLALERARIAPMLETVPPDPEGFIDWFENLEQTGYGQRHPLFIYLAERASREEFQYFFQQESLTEAGFDDLVALTQVKAPPRVKMELAQNYWDEMGRGNPAGMHSTLLQRVSDNLGLGSRPEGGKAEWAPLALSNVMMAMATSRCRFYQAIGALGVIELTAPGRCVQVIQGLKRIGVPHQDYHYYSLHASLDRKHWAGWRDNAIRPLVEELPDCIPAIAEGALLRLHAGQYCYDTYSRHLHLDTINRRMPQPA